MKYSYGIPLIRLSLIKAFWAIAAVSDAYAKGPNLPFTETGYIMEH